MPLYALTPNDVLFFRDGRPIEAAGGHGARWPEPSLIFDAIHAALHRAFPLDDAVRCSLENNAHSWEHAHRFGRSSDRDPNRHRTQRFGSLQTAGLFPVLENGDWLFPSPQDVVASGDPGLHLLSPLAKEPLSRCNLPAPLKYSLASPCEPSKEESKPWWTRKAFDAYLRGQSPDETMTRYHGNLFAGEWATGIGIDPLSQTQDGERIYSAEYLRLNCGVRLGFAATLPMKQNGARDNVRDCIAELLTKDRSIVVGGQQRVCSVEEVNCGQSIATVLPRGTVIEGMRVKWVLLTPAVFPGIAASEKNGKRINPHRGGWLPNWINSSTGKVELLDGPGLEKAKRRNVQAGNLIDAHLVAARVPKPIPITGWTEAVHLKGTALEREHGARQTHLAVPAGAVYYFESGSVTEAQKLAMALNWHGRESNPTTIKNRRSTLLGEKGFGLGVCGTWQFFKDVAGRSEK